MTHMQHIGAVAFGSGIQALSLDEIDQVNGGSRAAAVIRVIDWVGRVLTVQAAIDALPEVDLKELGDHEQSRRPGAGG